MQHAELFDGAVILGGYAETKGAEQQEEEALALMQVPVRILMVHGLDDGLCRPKYLKWHSKFELAMQDGRTLSIFASFTVPGTHDTIDLLIRNLTFHELSNPHIDGFWRAMLGSASHEAV